MDTIIAIDLRFRRNLVRQKLIVYCIVCVVPGMSGKRFLELNPEMMKAMEAAVMLTFMSPLIALSVAGSHTIMTMEDINMVVASPRKGHIEQCHSVKL